jgi:hypothetical protein
MTRKSSNPKARRPQRRLARRALPARPPEEDCSPEDAQQLQERLLAQIATGAVECQEIENQLRQHAAPELETIIKLHRVLVLKLSAESQAVPEVLHLVGTLMKPVMDWARLEEKRKDRDLAQRKYRDQLAAQKAATEDREPSGALRPETLQKIEHELKLF